MPRNNELVCIRIFGQCTGMDNLSHSLVGLALGELAQRSLPAEPDSGAQSLRRRMLLVTGFAASNFPDLDLVLSGLLPAPLGYLLHHRGHTHTLLLALGQALVLAALVWLLWPGARALLRTSAAARAGLAAVAGVGLVLHIGMDFLNSYGVHPFYPFSGRWVYGDMLFILEPVIWVAFGVPLAMMVRSRVLRWSLLALLGGIVVWATSRAFLHWGSLLGLGAAALAMAWAQHRAGERGKDALLGALALALAFIGTQGAASSHGKRLVAAELQRLDPATRVLDTAMTGFPANPLCWIFVSAERNDSAGIYRLRRGILSVAPGMMPTNACPAAFTESLAPDANPVSIAWTRQESLATLRTRSANCHFQAWMRFARMPVLAPGSATDVRFAMGDGENFSTFPFARFDGQPCPAGVPPWDAPRQDLLAP